MTVKKGIGLIAGLAGVLVLGGLGSAGAWAADNDDPPPIVEDFNYPGADAILAQRGIKLIKGSGTIMLADCPSAVTSELVWINTLTGYVCFKATSSTGYLTMEIEEVYSIRGDNNNGTATITVDEETAIIPLEKGAWRGVGVGEDPTKGFATLLEIRLVP